MTKEHQASRTIVKSPPELWAECSHAGSLARHIGEFGEIRITRLEPERSVAWDGEHASGTVEIEPSGWGTKVTLRAEAKIGQVVEEPATGGEEPATVVEEPSAIDQESPKTESKSAEEATDEKVEETTAEPDPVVAADAGAIRGWRRLIARARALFKPRSEVLEATPSPEPHAVEPPDAAGGAHPPTEAQADSPEDAEIKPVIDPAAVLTAALDSLGRAHHRPFSRA